MSRPIVQLPILLLMAAVGCSLPAQPSSRGAGPGRMPMAPTTAAADGASPEFALVLKIRLTSIEVPVGTASGSEEIWSYLDEERTRAVHSASLGRNGLRVGLTNESSWPDLARILRKMTGQKISEQFFMALPSRPFQIELKTGLGVQTIFSSYADRTLSGADYPGGDDLLALNCSLDGNDNSKLIVTALPQIRSTQRVTDIVPESGILSFVDHAVTYNLDAATFQLSMSNKDILVIGPGAESRRPTSIGYHFLLHQRQNMPFETVLVLAIEVIKAPLKSTPVNAQF